MVMRSNTGGAAYVNSLRDTAILTALTDAVIAALARQPLTVFTPRDAELFAVESQQARSLRRLVLAAQLIVNEELADSDE